ncbi:MAG TPA: L-threonylcarbamoyladenylate synthase [Clostridium sp.]
MQVVTTNNTNWDELINHMKEGNPIIIPTDTNYALACFPDSIEAIDKIFLYKKRKKNKPLSLFFLDPNDWEKYGDTENKNLLKLIVGKFWPGPLNIIIKKKVFDYDYMLNNGETIALGCVSNPSWRKFMSNLNGKAIGMTSSNISGTADDILVTEEIAFNHMKNKVKYFLESKQPIKNTKSSTIITIKNGGVEVLREGDISTATLTDYLHKEGYSVNGK